MSYVNPFQRTQSGPPNPAAVVSPTPYLGLVGSRTGIPDTSVANAQPWMVRFGFYARDAITALKCCWSNWYGDEQDPGGTMTLTASVEYPAGTFTQLQFSGSATGVTATKTNIWTDMVTIPGGIPEGALAWIRFRRTCSVNYVGASNSKVNVAMGDMTEQNGADTTMGGTITPTGTGLLTPSAIVGLTTKRTLAVIGDSIQAGQGDDATTPPVHYGTVLHALGMTYANTNLGLPGRKASGFLATHALRDDILQYASDIVNAYGVNDIFVDHVSAATLETTQAAIRALYPSKRYFLTTLTPETTSTDSFKALSDQTARVDDPARVTYNANRLAAPTSLGATGVLNCAAVLESGSTSKWKVDGTAFKYTVDGTHPSAFGYALFDTSGLVLP